MGGFVRIIFIQLDKVVFGLIDTAYNLIFSLASLRLGNLSDGTSIVKTITNNLYVVVGVFALFRIALLLVNSIIDPEKLNEKGKGLSNIFGRTVIMLVLLIVTPMLFGMAYDFQGKVIGTVENGQAKGGHIIEKLILGKSAAIIDESEGVTPGDQFKSIALSTVISVNHVFVNKISQIDGGDTNIYLRIPEEANGWTGGYESNGNTCKTQSCVNAIDSYNNMYVNGKMDINRLAMYISTSEKVEKCPDTGKVGTCENGKSEKEKEYVYDYSVVLSTFISGFIVYIMFSFALDIAARFFELIALEILSPLFIVTFIDSKSASSGMFNRWLKAVGSTYASLFIRIATISLLLLFVSILSHINMSDIVIGDNGAWVKVTLMLGALLFAKKAPKWFSEMIGLKSEGLGGLGIGKKIAAGALGGALLAKGAKGLVGAGTAGAMNLGKLATNRREARKKIMDNNPDLKLKNRREARKQRALDIMNDKINNEGFKPNDNLSKWAGQLAKQEQREKLKNARNASGFKYGGKQTVGRIGNALLNGALSFKAAANADKLSGSLKIAKDNSDTFKRIRGLEGTPIKDVLSDRLKEGYNKNIVEKLYGSASEIAERADQMKKAQFIKDNWNPAWARQIQQIPGFENFDPSKLINGKGAALKYSKTADNVDIDNFDYFLRSAIAGAAGYNIHYDKDPVTGKFIQKPNGLYQISYSKDGKTYAFDSDFATSVAEQAKHCLSFEGSANLQELFNFKTGNLLRDVGQNEDNINNTVQAIQQIGDSISKTSKAVADKLTSSLSGIGDKIKNSIQGSISDGSIKVNFNSIDGISNSVAAQLGNIELSSSADIANLIGQLQTSPDVDKSNSEVQEVINMLNQMKNNQTIENTNSDINQIRQMRRLQVSKTEELNGYLDVQTNMEIAYKSSGYKFADKGKMLFEGDGLETAVVEAQGFQFSEKKDKQQSQEGRLNDQKAVITKQKQEKDAK